jgi:ribosomal protein S12 methylthiotransferase
MLRRMARRVTREQTVDLLGRLRARMDNLTIRTTFITGFPGETDEQFDELVDFTREQKFEHMGVFTYSLEPDTPAAALPGHLDEEIKQQRRERLMAEQQQIAFDRANKQIGQTLDVILDIPVPEEEGAWIGRSASDAPDVDACVYVSGENLAEGQIVACEIVATKGYDLIGAAVEVPR